MRSMEELDLDRRPRKRAGLVCSYSVLKTLSDPLRAIRFVLCNSTWNYNLVSPEEANRDMMMKEVSWTTRRILWTAGVGLVGFLIGGTGWGLIGSILGLIWGAGIGCGFGSIFDQRHATRRIVFYWAATMALVGPFFSLIFGGGVYPYDDSVVHLIAVGTVGVAAGMLFGSLIGIMQLKRLRRKPQIPQSGSVA